MIDLSLQFCFWNANGTQYLYKKCTFGVHFRTLQKIINFQEENIKNIQEFVIQLDWNFKMFIVSYSHWL